jgi:hypothetical protein
MSSILKISAFSAVVHWLNSLTFRLVKTFTHGISLGSIATVTNVFTVLGHINKLVEENLISDVQRRTLFSQVPQNPALDDWVKQGIDSIAPLLCVLALENR